jgi:hypothetical protein
MRQTAPYAAPAVFLVKMFLSNGFKPVHREFDENRRYPSVFFFF